VYPKNSGSRKTTTRSSSFSARAEAKLPYFGLTAPKRNAPNSAWIPMISVIVLDARRPTNYGNQALRETELGTIGHS
jgi:hypothetical protein